VQDSTGSSLAGRESTLAAECTMENAEGSFMKKWWSVVAIIAFAWITVAAAQQGAAKPEQPSPTAKIASSAQQYSGMYSFLKDGEFAQLTVEDNGHVTGFISRYGDGERDKGAFLDQFFKSGKLDGNKLSFTTAVVNGVWFDFAGTVERGEGKNPDDEAYYVLKGSLMENSIDADKKVKSPSRDVLLKRFPLEGAAGK
jgi:hypothetical protein